MMATMDKRHAAVLDDIFGPHAAELGAMMASPHDEQLAWARSIQDRQRGVVVEFQAIEVGRHYDLEAQYGIGLRTAVT